MSASMSTCSPIQDRLRWWPGWWLCQIEAEEFLRLLPEQDIKWILRCCQSLKRACDIFGLNVEHSQVALWCLLKERCFPGYSQALAGCLEFAQTCARQFLNPTLPGFRLAW